MLLCLLLASPAWALDATGDLTEFANSEDARAFGWSFSGGAPVEVVADACAGKTALRVKGGPDAKAYTGMLLKHAVDLSNAGPGDKIVFHVKQNYKAGIYLNIHGQAGHIYRSVSLKAGEWARVEFDLDRQNWDGKASEWGLATAFAFYHRNFDKPDEYMVLDGFSIFLDGKVYTPDPLALSGPPAWELPCETEQAWYLGNDDAAWGVSKKTGQVAGGWYVTHKERCLQLARSRCHVEDLKGLVTGNEDDDTIEHASFDRIAQTLNLLCANPSVPELAIRKEYRLDGFRLFKTTLFAWRGEPRKFITYNTEVALMPDYRQGGYYMGAGFVGPIVPAPDLSTWKEVKTYKTTTKGMLLYQPRKDYAFAHARSRVDGNFTWPWFSGAINGYVEAKNTLHYTPFGWDFSLGTSPLRNAAETTFEEYFRIVPGNWFTWLAETYPRQPEVAKESARIPQPPEWVSDVKVFFSYGRGGLARVKRVVESTDEGTIMVLVGAWGSWADYYVKDGLQGGDGGWITGPELRDLVQRIQAVSPRVKVGIYQWVASCLPSGRIYKQHPDWFRIHDKQGIPKTTFPGMIVNYASMLSVAGCYNELLNQFDHVLDYLGTDFIYLDDPKAMNMVNWHSGDYTRDDLSYRFLLDLRKVVAKHGKDKMLFFNCRGNPYADVNFVEARDQLRAGWWRDFAGLGACMEAFLAVRPKARIIPLYWTDPLAREYVNRVLALGWIPSLTYGSDIGRLPFARAAYEMGNSHQVNGRYTPDWKTDPETNIESYLTQREDGSGYVLSLISHEERTSDVPVTLDLSGLDLAQGRQVWVWDHQAEDALSYDGLVTERIARTNYKRSGWHLDRVLRRRLLYAGTPGERLALNVTLQPLILHQLTITSLPAAVYSEDGLPNNYLFAQTKCVRIRDESSGNERRLTITCQREHAEVMVFAPELAAISATLDGKPARPVWVAEDGAVCPVFAVSKGRHELSVKVSEREPRHRVPKELSAESGEDAIAVKLPDCDYAIFSLEKDSRTFFNRAVRKRDGAFRIPYADVCEAGSYTLACRGIVDERGAWTVSGPKTQVALSKRSVDLGIPSDKHPRFPEKLALQSVNRTVSGVQVLRSAEYTTSTPIMGWQPKLQALEAKVDPDTLSVHAGTTRKIMAFRGAAFAGLEIENLRRVKLKLANSYYEATHIRGMGRHDPQYQRSEATFGGIVVDYHTAKGYTHRVGFAVGLLDPKCNCRKPEYGKNGPMDTIIDLGPIVDEGPERVFSLDLAKHAPEDWDGRVWFSVGSMWAAPDRRLTATILAVNDAVRDGFLTGDHLHDEAGGRK